MSFAIFILPEGGLITELVRWKERVKNELPDQPYTAHPPHLTLINMEVRNEEDGIDAVIPFSGSLDPFQISVNRTDVFWSDNVTGGHTIFFGIEKNESLYALQQSLADALLKVKKNSLLTNYNTDNKQLFESYNKYGFPFVGDHWIPHFSVSSLMTEKTYPIIEDFLSTTIDYHFTVKQLSLWEVDGDVHTHLQTVKFK